MNRIFQCLCVVLFCETVIAQQTDFVDFKSVEATVFIDQFEVGKIFGTPFNITFDITKSIDSVYIHAVNMKFEHVLLNNEEVEYVNTGKKIIVYHKFKKNRTYKLKFDFYVSPKKAMYFIKNEDGSLKQLWTQGQGKYTSHWLPSIDDVNDKIEFDLTFNAPKAYQVLSNGVLKDSIKGLFGNWFYDMNKPMSSYLVALTIGDYDKKTEISKSGIPLEYYYYPKDSLKVEPTYRYTKEMFDFMEKEIGYSFPWQNYKQVPVVDFLYAGMENTSLTIFSDNFVVDSTAFNDKNYITVNAHELAHQWFGNLVTAKSSEHHWLQEGFATYYAMLAERHVFGDDHYYWQLFEYAQELLAQESAGQSTSLLNPKSSSTTFYKKGAWALHVLREKVGDSAFKLAVSAYLQKHQYSNVETKDFISEVEQASSQDLTSFVDEWLMSKILPEDRMVKSLKKSAFMNEYLKINCKEGSAQCKAYLSSTISDKAKIKIISQIPDQIDGNSFNNSLSVRQAIARYVDKIPAELKLTYETLLDDDSYLTIENALYHLWANFPEERVKYLQKTKNIVGFNDYNVRLLWLALHLNTAEYQSEKKQLVLNEMVSYSLPNNSFELRQNAFNYLKLIGGFEEKSIKSLLEASRHHNWRFSKYAKNELVELEKKPRYKIIIDNLKQE